MPRCDSTDGARAQVELGEPGDKGNGGIEDSKQPHAGRPEPDSYKLYPHYAAEDREHLHTAKDPHGLEHGA